MLKLLELVLFLDRICFLIIFFFTFYINIFLHLVDIISHFFFRFLLNLTVHCVHVYLKLY